MDGNTMKSLKKKKARVNAEFKVQVVLLVIYFVITIPIFCYVAVQSKVLEILAGVIYVPLTLGIIVLSVILRSKGWKKYENEFKETVAVKILDESFDSWKFEPQKGFTKEDFFATGIEPLNEITTFRSSDWIEGEYKGVTFCQADLYIVCKTTPGTSKESRETVIDGEMLRIYNKKYAKL